MYKKAFLLALMVVGTSYAQNYQDTDTDVRLQELKHQLGNLGLNDEEKEAFIDKVTKLRGDEAWQAIAPRLQELEEDIANRENKLKELFPLLTAMAAALAGFVGTLTCIHLKPRSL